jgi:glycosyltransferase involved in cell wall biosynthesis
MKFSVVMASRLASYPSAGRDRENKLLRAVNSVLCQTFEDWELLIIADGCPKTIELITGCVEDERVSLWKVEHKKLWSGTPRNTGIEQAKGEWIIYLDNDDIYGERHLEIVNRNLANYDWVWFNDIHYKPRGNYWYINPCNIQRMGKHGTSNIAHKRSLNVFWDVEGKYAHDYYFTRKLLTFPNGGVIETPEYYVCHVPGVMGKGGYDV